MSYATRKKTYRAIEAARDSKVISFITSDRAGMETQIAGDAVDMFVDLLDKIGPTKKVTLVLHTNGGQTAAAWRLVNLLRSYADDLEVLVPMKAMSAGTLISIGADRIVMTKQAVLGPIDPSVNHPLGPATQMGNQMARVPVSVEAVRGYLDAAKSDFGIKEPEHLTAVLLDLSNKVHPLVIGDIFRSRSQIRFLADKLIRVQVTDPKKIKSIIDFLCADSGSHDYTINRREAEAMGLKIEKPTAEFYGLLKTLHGSFIADMELLTPYSPQTVLGVNQAANYTAVRGLIESTAGGSYGFLSEGTATRTMVPGPVGPQEAITDQRTFEGWRKLA